MKANLKFYTLLFLLCILFQNSYSQQNTNGWFWANSQPQSNHLNWVKIINATTIYAVGENGTFMKSTDGGDTWLINSQAGVSDPSFGSGATYVLNTAWFFDANTGMVAGQSVSGDGGFVRRTTDAGQTFFDISLGLGSGISSVRDIYFINSTTGYLCGNSTVQAMMTTDAGLTWTQYNNLPAPTVTYNSLYAVDANHIYLGESSGRKMVRTTDAGASWTEDVLPGTISIDFKDIIFQNLNTGYVGGNSNYFAYTTDGGNSWTQAISPTTQQGMYDLYINGSTVYALGSYTNYYTTTNFGVTWNAVSFDDPSNVDQPGLSTVYAFDFNGSNIIVVGAYGKVNISNDNGVTWRNKNYSVGNCAYPFSSVCALPGTGQVWAASNGGGLILYSTNNGTNWTKSFTGAPNAFYDVQMKNSSTGYATGGNYFAGTGYCYKTTNSGINWISLPITTPNMQMNSASFVDVNTGWIVGGLPFGTGSQISKTTNGGLTWATQVTTPASTSAHIEIGMADANTGYLLSFIGTIFKTTNGGTNWTPITGYPALSWQSIKVFSPSTAYIAEFGTNIIKTFDGGLTWSTITTPSSLASIFSMDWTDLNNGMVVGTQGYTAKTTDGGITWTERNTGSSTITGVSLVSKDTVYAVCDRNVYGAIFRLYDNLTSVSFNTTVGIQGFWNGTIQVSDTVKCHLRNSTSPYSEVAVTSAVLDNSGFSSFIFNTVPSGSYYIEITHRNSLETWSAAPQAVVPGGTYNYDFTSAASQAFGNNLKLTSGKYCDYSGDVNQDGFINLTDVLQIFNASSVFASGYIVTDVNGDNIADLTDITFAYNNSTNFVQKVTP